MALAEIKAMLQEAQRGKLADVTRFATDAQLADRFQLGYALLYTDGRKTLHYGQPLAGLRFDPGKARLDEGSVCIDFAVANEFEFRNVCVSRKGSGETRVVRHPQFQVVAERLAEGPEGIAWVIGVSRP